MKMILGVILLLVSSMAHATTKIAKTPGQASDSFCELRAKYLGNKAVKLMGGVGREARFENAVYWQLESLDASSPSCLREANVSVRIRAADFRGPSTDPVITYPVNVREPSRNQAVRIKIRFVQGKDTFLNRDYSEWLFAGLLDD